ncbi:MAG: tetratricopeptide repeat protein [Richelia sp. RM1_1_1]|nr:tetratricopeptide repeat protein [Richelia sp. RM1_1_1]
MSELNLTGDENNNACMPLTPQDYLDFLVSILQLTADDNRDLQKVYSLLQENLTKLDETFINILRYWATSTWSGVQAEEALIIAAVIVNFSNLIRSFPYGNIATNLEIAIAGCEVVAPILTREAFPEFWATTQNILGAVYRIRIAGDRALNLEQAISCYQNALQVRTQTDFPENWAETQNNLGNAYSERISGIREENLDLAISAYQAALQVHTREAFSQEWAKTHNNLALVYRERGQSFEAITHLRSALEVYTPTTFPIECLVCGRNLGNIAYTIKDWDKAIEGYSVAIAAVEQSRSWVNTDKRRQEVLGAAIDVYAKMVQIRINTAQCDRALEYVERSKTRNLVELLVNKNLYPSRFGTKLIRKF